MLKDLDLQKLFKFSTSKLYELENRKFNRKRGLYIDIHYTPPETRELKRFECIAYSDWKQQDKRKKMT